MSNIIESMTAIPDAINAKLAEIAAAYVKSSRDGKLGEISYAVNKFSAEANERAGFGKMNDLAVSLCTNIDSALPTLGTLSYQGCRAFKEVVNRRVK